MRSRKTEKEKHTTGMHRSARVLCTVRVTYRTCEARPFTIRTWKPWCTPAVAPPLYQMPVRNRKNNIEEHIEERQDRSKDASRGARTDQGARQGTQGRIEGQKSKNCRIPSLPRSDTELPTAPPPPPPFRYELQAGASAGGGPGAPVPTEDRALQWRRPDCTFTHDRRGERYAPGRRPSPV